MREIFRQWLQEFCHDGYDVLYCMGEDGDAPSSMQGDRFFLLQQGEFEPDLLMSSMIIMWSEREEEFYFWNENGSWLTLNLTQVPQKIIDLVKKK